MSAPAMHVTEALLGTRFGPEAIVSRVGAIWLEIGTGSEFFLIAL